MNARLLYHMARADFLERARRHSFLVTVAGTIYVGYLVNAGYVNLSIDGQRGVFNSAWVGTLTALTLSFLLPLFGFYLIKNTIERDRATGVGEILAATPLSRAAYTLGKTASNFLFLGVVVAILAVAGLAMQLLSGEDARLDLGAFLGPLVWLALPAVALVSALAVLFETVRWLRGSLGNVIYFFGWLLMIPVAMETGIVDPIGAELVQTTLKADLAGRIPSDAGVSFTIGPRERDIRTTFTWEGIDWTAGVIAGRLGYAATAMGLALLAALPFGRFDPAREGARRAPKAKADGKRRRWRVALPSWSPRSAFTALVLAELRLMLRGRNRGWWVVALGLLGAGIFAPLGAAREVILPLSWIWPIALWSGLGARERLHGTEQLVFAAPRPVAFHAAALWAAGVLVTALAGSAVAFRFAAAGDRTALLAWLGACLFIPSLALALGSWSGSGKAFEVVYLVLWYIGPMNHVPGVDYIGTTARTAAAGYAWLYLGIAAALLATAVAGRARQARV